MRASIRMRQNIMHWICFLIPVVRVYTLDILRVTPQLIFFADIKECWVSTFSTQWAGMLLDYPQNSTPLSTESIQEKQQKKMLPILKNNSRVSDSHTTGTVKSIQPILITINGLNGFFSNSTTAILIKMKMLLLQLKN